MHFSGIGCHPDARRFHPSTEPHSRRCDIFEHHCCRHPNTCAPFLAGVVSWVPENSSSEDFCVRGKSPPPALWLEARGPLFEPMEDSSPSCTRARRPRLLVEPSRPPQVTSFHITRALTAGAASYNLTWLQGLQMFESHLPDRSNL